MATVIHTHIHEQRAHFRVQGNTKELKDIKMGASVSIDGVCLTVVDAHDDAVCFDVMGETLAKTTLNDLFNGRRVNIERSIRVGDEIGGHIVSGHVSDTAQIHSIDRSHENYAVTFSVSAQHIAYIFPKGFLALDGVSLTVANVSARTSTFCVWLIPETISRTTFGWKKVGDRVNMELDAQTVAIVRTVTSYMQNVQH